MGDTWLWEVEEHQERCSHVVYAAGEGIRIRFQHDSWSGPISLKELYQEFFVSAVVQDALILYAPDGGGRSWNLLFRREFNDWETRIFYSFFEHVSAKIPRGMGDDVTIWQLNRLWYFLCALIL